MEQQAAMQVLQATVPLQYTYSAAGGGSQMLMTSLNPSRKGNPVLSSLSATPTTSLRYNRLAMAAGKQVQTKPVYGSNYYGLTQGYAN